MKCAVIETIDVIVIESQKPVSYYWKYLLLTGLTKLDTFFDFLHAFTNIDTFLVWKYMVDDISHSIDIPLKSTIKVIKETYSGGVSNTIFTNKTLKDIVVDSPLEIPETAVSPKPTETIETIESDDIIQDMVFLKIEHVTPTSKINIKREVLDYSHHTNISHIFVFENIDQVTNAELHIAGFHGVERFTTVIPLDENVTMFHVINHCKKMKNKSNGEEI